MEPLKKQTCKNGGSDMGPPKKHEDLAWNLQKNMQNWRFQLGTSEKTCKTEGSEMDVDKRLISRYVWCRPQTGATYIQQQRCCAPIPLIKRILHWRRRWVSVWRVCAIDVCMLSIVDSCIIYVKCMLWIEFTFVYISLWILSTKRRSWSSTEKG